MPRDVVATVGIVFVRHAQTGRSGRGRLPIKSRPQGQQRHPCTNTPLRNYLSNIRMRSTPIASSVKSAMMITTQMVKKASNNSTSAPLANTAERIGPHHAQRRCGLNGAK